MFTSVPKALIDAAASVLNEISMNDRDTDFPALKKLFTKYECEYLEDIDLDDDQDDLKAIVPKFLKEFGVKADKVGLTTEDGLQSNSNTSLPTFVSKLKGVNAKFKEYKNFDGANDLVLFVINF